jgi:hypothetical protein
MGLVSNDLSDWLAEASGETESEGNPFGVSAERAAMAHVHALWHRAAYRVHKWIDAEWEPESRHGDGLTR